MADLSQDRFRERKNGKDINLKEFFYVIKKRLWIIAVVTILASVAGYYISNMNNSLLYQSSTRIIIGSDSEYMKTLMVMIKDPIIMEKVKEELELSRSSEGIANQVEVARIDESQVIKISVIDSDPKMAMDIANATAKSFKSEVGSILDFDDVQLLSEAKRNNHPINESNNRILIILIVFGLITGIGLVFLLDSLDETVYKEQEVEEVLGVPVLGVVSDMRKIPIKRGKQKEIEIRSDVVGFNE